MLHLYTLKGQHRTSLVGADGPAQRPVPQNGPGNAWRCGTALKQADQLLTLTQTEQSGFRSYVHP